ncbi:MAG: hypothetical protein H6885_00010 [Rhodobiaceae bacterium]|nr:hypothetical protein [Rhodobiaceae bacterium]
MAPMNRRIRAIYFQRDQNSGLYRYLCQLRRHLFADQLGWSLDINNGLEEDQFDHQWAEYCALFEGEHIRGCFRAIPCDRPYLVKDAFANLAPLDRFPVDDTAWEISRFGVDKSFPYLGRHLYCAMFEFAWLRNASALPALVDIQHERLLQRMGIETQRYGEPSHIGIDAYGRPIVAVVGEIPLMPQLDHLRHIFAPTLRHMEIIDETSVFGSHRIPA